MKRIFAFSMTGWLVVFSAFGQDVPPAFERAEAEVDTPSEPLLDPFDPFTNAPLLIRVQVEHVELSHKDLTRLLMDDKGKTADAKDLRMKVQELVEKDAAKVLDTQIVIGRSGQKSQTQSHEELTYPTEYEPPGSEEVMKEMVKKGVYPQNPAIATAFEMRPLGSSLESEPTVGPDDKLIDLRIVTELTWHTGDSIWYQGKDAAGNVSKVTTPLIYNINVHTSITCISGQYVFVGALSPKTDQGKLDTERKVMVFAKCNVLPVVP